ncbi:MAG: AlkA N-terminal domain-containing protein [Acidimicrobiia bacterium]
MSATEDFERCYRAVQSRDARFDGWFFTAVTSTSIYCRPSCPAITPKRQNVRFYPTAAAAQANGFRACRRCRPDAAPGSPEWNTRSDVVARAMRLIADGVVDREGVSGLARRLGYSDRQLHRLLHDELGVGPIAIARAQRAHTARLLIETTTVPVTDIAFAAGFSSVRQFNDTIRAVFATTPSDMRRSRPALDTRAKQQASANDSITLRLPARQPFDASAAIAFLGKRTVPGVEHFDPSTTTYTRSLRLPHGPAVVALTPKADHVHARLTLTSIADLAAAVARSRRLLDLDADPTAVDTVLGVDEILAPLVAKLPGLRVPGAVDGAELAARALLGQQVSVSGARTLAARLATRFGEHIDLTGHEQVDRLFPDAATLAEAPDDTFAMPASRKRTVRTLMRTIANGEITLDPGADRDATQAALLAIAGIGPWTASYIAMRALGDPDAFPASDLGVKHALEACGVGGDPKAAVARAERWRPWRSYATLHLWNSLERT